ncbi:MAG: outer membrane lipoprotein carrier protein LolA [Bacteroidetes bacterium]|nr:outer membrane lipoprotein carrier protein LolA [Bacteroidota bacterium]HET6244627.1 outer membrane lipoprotein carrier protein LolA [Bacteroidia bacterium]
MFKKTIVLIFFSCLYFNANAQVDGYKAVSDVEGFKKKLANSANATQSIRSNFVQEKNLSVLSEKIVSKGEFAFKKQNMVRMEYKLPFKYLMVINQDKVMIKDEQKTNSFSSKSNKLFAVINNIVVDCVQGTALMNKDFSSKIFENDKYFLLVLTPQKKELKEFFTTISIYLDKNDISVYKMDMLEPTGDNTVITFLNKEFNVNIPDAEFIIN